MTSNSPPIAEVFDQAKLTARLPALFLSHGSPLLAVQQSSTTRALVRMGQNLPLPRAVIVLSAHWQSTDLLVNTAPWPLQWHDYQIRSTNPDILALKSELSALNYRPKGDPDLALQVLDLLHRAGISAYPDQLRPLDHGVWSPLSHLYPMANVPVVQISLPSAYGAQQAYELGQILAPLRDQQVMLIGSGSITHNLSMASQAKPDPKDAADVQDFAYWLINELSVDPKAAFDWQSDPRAKAAHPTPEHLLPLFFAAGVAPRISTVHSSHRLSGLGMGIYRFD